MKKSKSVTFIGLLQIMFIGFKLTEVIDWSWWLVLLPIIIKVSLSLVVTILEVILEKLDDSKKEETSFQDKLQEIAEQQGYKNTK